MGVLDVMRPSAVPTEMVSGLLALESEAFGETSPETAVLMSLVAGLSTAVGAGVVFVLPGQQVSPAQMAFVLALAGGVMMSVTILEFWVPMLMGGRQAGPVIFYSLAGALSFVLLSKLVPDPDPDGYGGTGSGGGGTGGRASDCSNAGSCASGMQLSPSLAPTTRRTTASTSQHASLEQGQGVDPLSTTSCQSSAPHVAGQQMDTVEQQHRWRLAVVLMLSLTAHNFPEGFAVAISALQSSRLGMVVMVAIAMHNIPEGIAIAVSVLAATGSRHKALWMALLSGMAEPLGALVALYAVRLSGNSMSEDSMENLLCAVGGIMCAVAIKELLPGAWRQGKPMHALAGFVFGYIIMWTTSQLGA